MFGGVDILTLSACNTASAGADADGKEVEGFAEIAQEQGARSVVASLWAVADNSTRSLMEAFYRNRVTPPGKSKAEALREAQVALLTGKAGGPARPYAHPFYWAPFVLVGNWR